MSKHQNQRENADGKPGATKSKRSFSSSWKEGREWLLFDGDTMKCSRCVEYFKNENVAKFSSIRGQNTFITGSTNFKKTAVTDHEESKSHIQAVCAKTSRPTTHSLFRFSEASKALRSMKEAEKLSVSNLVRNAHAVAVNNRPLTDYVWLAKLDKAKSTKVGDTYLNEKAGLNFIRNIAQCERDRIIELLTESPFFTFIMDGSTDFAGHEQECIYVRTAFKGKVTQSFLNISSPRSTGSEDLHHHVQDIFLETGLDKLVNEGKLVGMTSDGASNMLGSKTGLATRIQKDHPEMIAIHCLCHRLELALKDAVKKVVKTNYDRVMTLLTGLFYLYRKSHKQTQGLLAAMEAVGVKGLVPGKVTGTRWLPHLMRGIRGFMRTFPAFVAHLSTSSHSNPKAEGLCKMMMQKELVVFMLYLQHILEPVETLSLKLQKTEITLCEMQNWLQGTIGVLQNSNSSVW